MKANLSDNLTYHQLLKIAQCTKTDYEDKESSRHQEDRVKIHHPSSKPRKDFGGKLAIRKIQITVQESSESEESPDEQIHRERKEVRRRPMRPASSKAGLSFKKEYGHWFKCGKAGHFARDCLENKEGAAKKNLNNKGGSKEGRSETPRQGSRRKKEQN